MKTIIPLTIVFALFLAPTAFAEISGAELFKKCKSCHILEAPSAEVHSQRIGPNIWGLENRAVASVEGFKYSKALTALGQEGAIWSTDLLSEFLADPKTAIPGNRMNFKGIEDETERQTLIDFLFTVTEGDAHDQNDPEVSAEILAIEGDPEYGEYLSSTCVTCHRLDGVDEGIPSIIGWPSDQFVTAMHAYKNKHRDNPVMQQYAGALSDEEIAALAAYFEGLSTEN